MTARSRPASDAHGLDGSLDVLREEDDRLHGLATDAFARLVELLELVTVQTFEPDHTVSVGLPAGAVCDVHEQDPIGHGRVHPLPLSQGLLGHERDGRDVVLHCYASRCMQGVAVIEEHDRVTALDRFEESHFRHGFQ